MSEASENRPVTGLSTQVGQPKEMPFQQRRWLILATVVIGTFMAILDVFIVNVAIPSISKGLGASFSEIELVIASYTLAYAVLVITGGRLGDLYGCPRVYPQITRMITGYAPTDPAFEAERTHFLRQLGQRLAGSRAGDF